MRAMPRVLPSFVSSSRVEASVWAAVAAGLPVSLAAFAGLYPQFDGGRLRLLLAATTGPAAAAIVTTALRGRRAPSAAAVRTLGMAAVGGVACTVLPAAALSFDGGAGTFLLACTFGVFFGSITGLVYGAPLALLAGIMARHARAGCSDGDDRAARVAGLWSAAAGVAVLAWVLGGLERRGLSLGLELHALAVPAAASLLVVGALVAAAAHARVARRARWLARVERGLEPALRLRPWCPSDEDLALPRVRPLAAHVPPRVLEWHPDPSGSTYRARAEGVPVAVV